MSRTTIQQFRASLAGDADQSTLMRAYRVIAKRPAPIGHGVGAEWTGWPPAAATAGDWGPWTAEARASGDWLQWAREAGSTIPLGSSPLSAGWVKWPDGDAASARAPHTRLAAWGDWSTPPVASA